MPTIVKGAIFGPIRYETISGKEFTEKPRGSDGWTYFENFKPFKKNGELVSIAPLQKYSSHGWLKTNPDGFYWWSFPKLQKKDAAGNWIPGSEWGWFYRKPFSWRYDRLGTPFQGKLEHWVYTWGYLGRHMD